MRTLAMFFFALLVFENVNAKAPSREACEAAYAPLYAKGVLNIRMVFGYKDTRPARFVGDRHERLAFVQRIVRPCKKGSACGFQRSPKNADLFLKSIPGPKGKTVKVQLWIAHSGVGSDDQENRTDLFQAWQSRYAHDAFFDGLNEADIVFYNGHSRFGGGPDFQPPHLDEKMVVSEAFYQGERPGFTKVLDVLQTQSFTGGPSGRLKMLGLFSCGSAQHFTEEIRQYSGVGLISSRNLMYFADALDNSVAALSSILERRCRSDFNKAIRNGVPVKGMFIEGLFKK